MSKRYKHPPIEEALCEFQFVPNQPWDLTIPGLIYERIKSEFPDREQQFGVGVQFRPVERGFEHKVEAAPPRIQFLRKNRTALIQVAPDLLAINQLRPYPAWNKFKPMIIENLERYKEVNDPRGFKRIGLRYINKIDTKAGSIELSDYFNFYPFVPQELPQIHASFISRVEIPYHDNRDRLLITIGRTLPEIPETISIILDIDYIMSDSESVSIHAAEEWIEKAHLSIEKVFESCITDKSRKLFQEIR